MPKVHKTLQTFSIFELSELDFSKKSNPEAKQIRQVITKQR